MPEDNCSVFGCGSCRRTKGIGIWKLPLAKDAAHAKWRDEWLGADKKDKGNDYGFQKSNLEWQGVHMRKAFKQEDIEICK